MRAAWIVPSIVTALLVFKMHSEIAQLRAEIVRLRGQVEAAGVIVTRTERRNIALEDKVIDLLNQLRSLGATPVAGGQ